MKKILFHALLVVFATSMSAVCAQEISYEGKIADGEVVCSDDAQFTFGPWKKSQGQYDEMIIGVYQTPKYSSEQERKAIAKFPVKREGIVMLKYNLENGQIKKGDPITSSSEPGVGMKATQPGMIVGIALEDASNKSGLIKIRVMIQYLKN